MLTLDGAPLTLEKLQQVAEARHPVGWSEAARSRVKASRGVIEEIIAADRVVYGVTTGFGKLSNVTIPRNEIQQLQVNLIRSHASGVGPALSEAETRAVMLLRAQVLAQGYSGVRPIVVDTLLGMLNAGVHPVIPSKGSVGASGDLAPLAHLALGMIGEGQVRYREETIEAREALGRAGIPPLIPEAKEGLSLINGTQGMTALGSLAAVRSGRLLAAADLAGAMSLEALRGTATACDPRIQSVRPHPGQQEVAARIRRLTEDSEIMRSHAECGRVQDAYSLRCIPQVHGAARDVWRHASEVLSVEINSVTDNPIVFSEASEVLSGGNFHGEPVALALDYLAMGVSELGAISERRIERLVNPDLSELPGFLSPKPGICSGMMQLQVTAVSLCGENKVLVHPASTDSLPTSGNKEDHVSMGMTAALKLRQIIENVETILAIELIAAAQALEFLLPLRPGKGTRLAFEFIRGRVPSLGHDRSLAGDIESMRRALPEIAAIAEPG